MLVVVQPDGSGWIGVLSAEGMKLQGGSPGWGQSIQGSGFVAGQRLVYEDAAIERYDCKTIVWEI